MPAFMKNFYCKSAEWEDVFLIPRWVNNGGNLKSSETKTALRAMISQYKNKRGLQTTIEGLSKI